MKTIFLTAYHGFIARNILNTDVLKRLRAEPSTRIVIFTPPLKKEWFERYYGGPNIIIEGFDLDPLVSGRKEKFWYRLGFVLQNSRYVRDQRGEQLLKDPSLRGFLRYLWLSVAGFVLSKIPVVRTLYRLLDYRNSSQQVFDRYIKQYEPSLFFSTDLFSEYDVLFLRNAVGRHIPTVGMVRSWDNTTTKGILRIIPDRVLVHSPVTKRELVQLHSCSANRIEIVGLPQFDKWIEGPTMSREQFFSSIGADPHKRLILFAPAGSILSDTDWQLCQILNDALEKSKLPNDVQFLVRNHPHHPADFSRFSDNPNFIFETPGVKIKKGDDKQTELAPDEHDHLRNSVFYTDMVMYVVTSLGLDASIFDKPQIMVNFDGWEHRPYVQSVRRYNREDCLANLVKLGGMCVVSNQDEWIAAINAYLENPKLHQDGRRRTIGQHMYTLDGKAGERIAGLILRSLERTPHV